MAPEIWPGKSLQLRGASKTKPVLTGPLIQRRKGFCWLQLIQLCSTACPAKALRGHFFGWFLIHLPLVNPPSISCQSISSDNLEPLLKSRWLPLCQLCVKRATGLLLLQSWTSVQTAVFLTGSSQRKEPGCSSAQSARCWSRVPKTSSARRHCRPESFCASGKFLRVFTKLPIKCSLKINWRVKKCGKLADCLEIFRTVWEVSG